MSNLFGVIVSEQESPVTVEVPCDCDLVITRAALSGSASGSTVLSIQTEDFPEPIVFGTFRSSTVEQIALDCNIAADSTLNLQVKGPNEVHLTGYYNFREIDEDDKSSEEGNLEGLLDMKDYNSSDDADFSAGSVESVSDSFDEDMPDESDISSTSPQKPVRPSPVIQEFPTQHFEFGNRSAKKEKVAKVTAKQEVKPKKDKTMEKKGKDHKKEKKKKEEPTKVELPKQKETKKEVAPHDTKGVKRAAPGTPEETPSAKKQKKAAVPIPPGQGFACPGCGKVLGSEHGREQHMKSTGHKAK